MTTIEYHDGSNDAIFTRDRRDTLLNANNVTLRADTAIERKKLLHSSSDRAFPSALTMSYSRLMYIAQLAPFEEYPFYTRLNPRRVIRK